MSFVSKTLAAGMTLGGAALGVGALVYQGALNTKLINTFAGIFHKPDPEVDTLYEGDLNQQAHRWFDENKGEDVMIYDEKAETAHAYVIWNEKPSHKWAIINHGYTSDPEATAAYAKHYYDLGYNTVSPCMRGFGHDEKHYCSMGHYDKFICLAWINYVVAIDPEAQIVLHGYSMGGATVNLTLGESLPENVRVAVSDCSYTNVYEQYTYVLKHNAGIPAFPLLDITNFVSKVSGNFDFRATSPIEAAAKSHTPTIFIHGDADDFVPFFMLDKMYNACAADKQKVVINGAKHAVSVFKDPETYWTNVDAFVGKYIK